MNESITDIDGELRAWLKGAASVVVAGIGNAIRSDDYVGTWIVANLRGKVSKAVRLFECETVPEGFIDEIVGAKPSHVLLIDAAMLGLRPGEVRLYDAEAVTSAPTVSTHALPLKVFCEYVRRLTEARVALLLIEPGKVDFGEGLTPEIASAAARVEDALLRALP